MRHRWSVAVLIAFAALAGYAAGARPVQAQADALPFHVGETVEFALQESWSRCRIEEMKGSFVRCGDPFERQRPAIGRREPPQEWINVAVVRSLRKTGEPR